MNVLVSGSSGMIGSAITAALQKDGHNVYPLLRNKREGPFYYLQKTNYIHLDRSIELDVVINLAGSNISQNRWTSRVKKNILDSRVKTTQTLCNALSELPQKPHYLKLFRHWSCHHLRLFHQLYQYCLHRLSNYQLRKDALQYTQYIHQKLI